MEFSSRAVHVNIFAIIIFIFINMGPGMLIRFLRATTGRSSVDDDLIYLLVQSAREPPIVLIAMSPILLESASDEYLDSIVLRSCIGQVIDTAGLFLEVPLLEGDRDGDGVVSADNGNLLSMLGNLRLEDTGHRGVVFVDFGSLTDWIVDTFHIHTLFSTLYLLGSTYRFVVVAHRQHERFRQVCEEVSREMPGVVSSPIILVAGDVQHTAVLHKFVSVVSHAGVGIVNTCLRIGIPQGIKSTFIVHTYIIFVVKMSAESCLTMLS